VGQKMDETIKYRLDKVEGKTDKIEQSLSDLVDPNYVRSKLKELDSNIIRIDKELTELELLVSQEQIRKENNERRVVALESTLNWIVRLIVGAVLLALLGLVLQNGVPL
jgi:hypothetical protein